MKINLSTTVAKACKVPLKKGFHYGIELEYENYKNLENYPEAIVHWGLVPDHSLRNGGIELVSFPLKPDQIQGAVEEAIKIAKSAKLKATVRCGLHVHVNMSDRPLIDVFKSTVLYTLLEPIIFALYAPMRSNSHFCVPLYANTALTEQFYVDNIALRANRLVDAGGAPTPPPTMHHYHHAIFQNAPMFQNNPAALDELVDMIDEPVPEPITGGQLSLYNSPKYSAINFNSLKKFGTMEYRQHASSLLASEIMEWVLLIHKIHTESYKWNDPLDIIQAYETLGLHTLAAKVGLKWEGHLPEGIDSLDIEDSIDSATIIAGHDPVDWQTLKWEIK